MTTYYQNVFDVPDFNRQEWNTKSEQSGEYKEEDIKTSDKMKSICIQHVCTDVDIEFIVEIFETKYGFEPIMKIERRLFKKNKYAKDYYLYFLYFNDGVKLHEKIKNNNKIYYNTVNYWVAFINMKKPFTSSRHMDLITRVPSTITKEKIESIVKMIDLGNVYKIESFEELDMPRDGRHLYWDTKSMMNCTTVIIRYNYWNNNYKSSRFQRALLNRGCVQFLDGHHQWRFYYEKPYCNGINPNIWYRPTNLSSLYPSSSTLSLDT